MLNTQFTDELNQPFYMYRCPMFLLTASTVLIVENGVVMVEENGIYRFPGGIVKAGQETIQFAAVRYVKEQTGVMLKKEALIPVDYRSSPERSKEGNLVDIGMVCMLNISHSSLVMPKGTKWIEVDFENKCVIKEKLEFYMDHNVLLERAMEIVLMMK